MSNKGNFFTNFTNLQLSVFSNSFKTLILKTSGIFLGYLVILMLSKNFGAQGVGFYNFTLATISTLSIFCILGLDIAVLRYVGELNNKNSYNQLFTLFINVVQILIPTSLVLGAVLYFSSDFISLNILNDNSYSLILKLIAISIPFLSFQLVGIEFIRGLKKISISELTRSVIRPLIGILVIFSLLRIANDNLIPVYSIITAIICSSIFTFIYIINKLRKIKNPLSNTSISKKTLLKTSTPLMFTSVFGSLNTFIPLFLTEIYMSTQMVGVYSLSVRLSLIVSIMIVSIHTAVAPDFSQLFWSRKMDELKRLVNFTARLNLIFSLIPFILICLFNEQILNLFSSEFILGKNVLIILSLSQLINSICGPAGLLLNMTGHEKISRNIIFFSFIITLIGGLILIPVYGIEGAAISQFIAILFLRILNVIFVRTKLRINVLSSLKPW